MVLEGISIHHGATVKTPLWEESAGALRALLFQAPGSPSNFVMTDLYTFELTNNLTLRFTTAGIDMGYDPGAGLLTFSSKGPRIDTDKFRAVAHWKKGVDVDSWQVVVYPRDIDDLTGEDQPDRIGDIPWIDACRGGMLDNAVVKIDRAYAHTWPLLPSTNPYVPVGLYRVFVGYVANIDYGRTGTVLLINSLTELLKTQMPRNLYQLGCIHTLFGPGCNVSGSLPQASFKKSGSVQAGSDGLHIVTVVGNPGGSGTFALGQIIFTSGKNAGRSEMINAWDGTTMTLRRIMPYVVAMGDTFDAYPGCDKTINTCVKFNNKPNFGGTPNVPAPETAS